MKKTRVLIVDDSSFVRKVLTRIFESDASMEVAGTAGSGPEALEKAALLMPDLITLDIMMPGMDGLETLQLLMKHRPVPVLMLSQLTHDGADLTLRALELGAMDFVDKSTTGLMDMQELGKEILSKAHLVEGARLPTLEVQNQPASLASPRGIVDIVAIGSSTGGPMALQMVLPKFPKTTTFATLIVQHMPVGFTGPFARRLDNMCEISVKEAEEGDVILPGHAYVAPAGLQMTIKKTVDRTRIKLGQEPALAAHKPSVDVLFNSVPAASGERTIGVLLTGMGSDGAAGLLEIRQKGGFTIAQDEETSTVYGMPRVAMEQGAVDKVLPINAIAEEILRRA